MLIDLILDRKDGCKYEPKALYELFTEDERYCKEPLFIEAAIAMKAGDEEKVKLALAKYAIGQDYRFGAEFVSYIYSVNWVSEKEIRVPDRKADLNIVFKKWIFAGHDMFVVHASPEKVFKGPNGYEDEYGRKYYRSSGPLKDGSIFYELYKSRTGEHVLDDYEFDGTSVALPVVFVNDLELCLETAIKKYGDQLEDEFCVCCWYVRKEAGCDSCVSNEYVEDIVFDKNKKEVVGVFKHGEQIL